MRYELTMVAKTLSGLEEVLAKELTALGAEEVRPFNRLVRYEVDVRRYTNLRESGASIVIGDGRIFVDGEQIAEVHGAKTGVFKGIAYPDYPRRSANSVGGKMGD